VSPSERSLTMNNNLKTLGLLIFFALLAAAPLLAQEGAPSETKASIYKISIIVGGAIITLAAAAGAFCQAKAISSACEGISRNPSAAPHIRFILLLGLILIETLVIYALLVTFIILMVKWNTYL
jgi:F-type H+-transporting ATPase subunit c